MQVGSGRMNDARCSALIGKGASCIEASSGKNDATPEPVCLPLEAGQVAEIRGLLRRSYSEGLPLMAEVSRNHTGCYLTVTLLDRATAQKIRKVLNAADKGPAPAPGGPPA